VLHGGHSGEDRGVVGGVKDVGEHILRLFWGAKIGKFWERTTNARSNMQILHISPTNA
jgi:hypothetical protein